MISIDEKKRQRLENAIRRNDIKEVTAIIAADVTDLDAKTLGGWTPLMSAVSNGNKVIVQLLVDAGADVWLLNNQNEDVFFIANKKGFDDILIILRSKKCCITL